MRLWTWVFFFFFFFFPCHRINASRRLIPSIIIIMGFYHVSCRLIPRHKRLGIGRFDPGQLRRPRSPLPRPYGIPPLWDKVVGPFTMSPFFFMVTSSGKQDEEKIWQSGTRKKKKKPFSSSYQPINDV
ncbi:hypothetical protein GGR50DRAFT_635211, partial [Xylaria sp. CBS 124048]